MKKKLLIGFATLAIATVVAFNMNFINLQKGNGLLNMSINKIEALADYEQGSSGTNWKTYTVDCILTMYVTSTDIYGIIYTDVTTVTVTKDVCGYGIGLCLSSAGC
ncbi:MAG: hypothetical protein FWD60_08665 [Candidatus Azobacteroides sp.]|nr:hypothetical protein [Candidatus Azobacteroides sp.]